MTKALRIDVEQIHHTLLTRFELMYGFFHAE